MQLQFQPTAPKILVCSAISCLGYLTSICFLGVAGEIRMHNLGEDDFYLKTAGWSLALSGAALTMAGVITGLSSVKALYAGGRTAARETFVKSIKPGGLLYETLIPQKLVKILFCQSTRLLKKIL